MKTQRHLAIRVSSDLHDAFKAKCIADGHSIQWVLMNIVSAICATKEEIMNYKEMKDCIEKMTAAIRIVLNSSAVPHTCEADVNSVADCPRCVCLVAMGYVDMRLKQ